MEGEISEWRKIFEETLTYPEIQPVLIRKVEDSFVTYRLLRETATIKEAVLGEPINSNY